MNDKQIADVDARQHPVDGKLVIVLTQAADNVVLVVAGRVLLAHDRDMVIRPVHGRTHQVTCAGICADVLLVDVLCVDRARHEMTVRCEHKAAEFGVQRHITHAGGHKDLLIRPAHAFADDGDVIGRLIWPVRDTNAAGEVKLHFTVSANHRRLFEEKLAEAVPAAEARTGRKFTVTLSEQKPSTDTIAANIDNDEPFLENDSLFFRPGGHGALIENLNDIDAAVVFIKNIDNVVPDRHRDATVRYKQVIGGYMMLLHDAIARFIAAIDAGEDVTAEAIEFMRHSLSTDDKRFDTLKGTDLVRLVRSKLDRPLRVCGMVRNEGEPGGGPYITVNPDGSSSLQILESTQIGPDYKDMMAGATHFNPVDLVCYIKNPAGVKYDLTRYVDPATGFISQKSSHGRELRAMELPGLWNGAMSDWNTAFLEVPVETFNPVKTVNDLLRPAHRK